MSKQLYVGNLSYRLTNQDLEQLFSSFGTVLYAKVIIDKMTGRSKGFAFVEMASDQEAETAIQNLNGKDVEGRALTVNEARPQEPRTHEPRNGRRGGGGGHYGGGGGGNYGNGGGGGRY
jgi:cold-inducible RNA-binding protein